MHFRLAQELGKHLHEVLDCPGPLTRRQLVVWRVWLGIDAEQPQTVEDPDIGRRMVEARKESAKVGSVVVEVQRSEMTPTKAADMLRAGVSRKKGGR